MSAATTFLAALTIASWVGYLASAIPPLRRAARDYRAARILLNIWRSNGAHGWPALRVRAPEAAAAAWRVWASIRLFPWAVAVALALVLLGLAA